MRKAVVNAMPAPTWNRLKINDITVSLPDATESAAECGDPDVTALGSALCATVSDTVSISGGISDIQLGNGETKGAVISAEKYGVSEVTEYISAEGNCALRTFADIPEGARVKLVQVIEGRQGSELLNDVGVKAADNARFEITQIFLGGSRTVSGVYAELDGFRSELECRIGYTVGKDELLDINNIVIHKGKRSHSETDVKGVLSDNAVKTFRGTIDLRNGASGAKGAENEDVLLIGETAVNNTVPVILCTEEDVEGSHGASIGRLPDDVLYYMTARGIPLEKANGIIAAARLESLIRGTGDEQTAERALKALAERSSDAVL